jgi:hypothetical protein
MTPRTVIFMPTHAALAPVRGDDEAPKETLLLAPPLAVVLPGAAALGQPARRFPAR